MDAPRWSTRRSSQDLVDRFVAAGATQIFTGSRACTCAARAGSSCKLAHHDDHLHVRVR